MGTVARPENLHHFFHILLRMNLQHNGEIRQDQEQEASFCSHLRTSTVDASLTPAAQVPHKQSSLWFSGWPPPLWV